MKGHGHDHVSGRTAATSRFKAVHCDFYTCLHSVPVSVGEADKGLTLAAPADLPCDVKISN